MPKRKFFDVKTQKSFVTDTFTKETRISKGRSGRRKVTLAIAKRDGRRVPLIIKNESAKK